MARGKVSGLVVWGFPLLGTATARRPVCLWPASRVAFAGCTSGAAGKGRVACGGQAKPDSFRNFFGRESRGAAGAATRGDGRVPLQGTCVWGVVRAGGRRSVIGRFHQPADAGPFANARLRRPTWSTAPSAVFPCGRRRRRVRRPGLPHGTTCGGSLATKFLGNRVRWCGVTKSRPTIPVGITEVSRGSSEATPPEDRPPNTTCTP